jgi:hypothetical protein
VPRRSRGTARSPSPSSSRWRPRHSAASRPCSPNRKRLVSPSRADQGSRAFIPTLAPSLPGFVTVAHGCRLSAPRVLWPRAAGRKSRAGDVLGVWAGSFRRSPHVLQPRLQGGLPQGDGKAGDAAPSTPERQRDAAMAGQRTAKALPRTDRKGLHHWYPRLTVGRLASRSTASAGSSKCPAVWWRAGH